jgi:5-formyltetrahydrofolate cyclo-ligase
MAVPSPFPASSKAELRAEGLRRRRAFAQSLSPELRADLEAALAELILPHLIAAQVVAAYHPLRDEISPLPILNGLLAGQRAAFPWFAGRDDLMIWREGPASEPSPWGVLQPEAHAEALSPDLVIVPIVLADRSGIRIGHGKGHYDRALAHLREVRPVKAIGICWEDQLLDGTIPADPWDVHLDAIATPKEWVTCR